MEKNNCKHKKTISYDGTFTGRQAVQKLIDTQIAPDEDEAVDYMAQILTHEKAFMRVDSIVNEFENLPDSRYKWIDAYFKDRTTNNQQNHARSQMSDVYIAINPSVAGWQRAMKRSALKSEGARGAGSPRLSMHTTDDIPTGSPGIGSSGIGPRAHSHILNSNNDDEYAIFQQTYGKDVASMGGSGGSITAKSGLLFFMLFFLFFFLFLLFFAEFSVNC